MPLEADAQSRFLHRSVEILGTRGANNMLLRLPCQDVKKCAHSHDGAQLADLAQSPILPEQRLRAGVANQAPYPGGEEVMQQEAAMTAS